MDIHATDDEVAVDDGEKGAGPRAEHRTMAGIFSIPDEMWGRVAGGVSPPALTDPGVSLSTHRAPVIQPAAARYYGARQIVRCNTVLTVFGGVGGIMVV